MLHFWLERKLTYYGKIGSILGILYYCYNLLGLSMDLNILL